MSAYWEVPMARAGFVFPNTLSLLSKRGLRLERPPIGKTQNPDMFSGWLACCVADMLEWRPSLEITADTGGSMPVIC